MNLSSALLVAASTRLLFRFFRRLGIFGVLLLSALDSSFLFLPFGNDLLLIAMISSRSRELNWMAYVVVSAIGSVIGVFVLDLIMRNAGEKEVERFIGEKRFAVLRARLTDKAGLTILLATILPPPFPFTPVVMTASVFQISRQTLFGTVFVGRLIRFTLEALLALYFGRKVIAYLNSDYVVYAVYGLIVVAVIGSVVSLVKWRRVGR